MNYDRTEMNTVCISSTEVNSTSSLKSQSSQEDSEESTHNFYIFFVLNSKIKLIPANGRV